MRRSIAIIDGLTGEEDSDFNELDSQARNYSNLAVSLLVTRPEQAEAASSALRPSGRRLPGLSRTRRGCRTTWPTGC